MRIVMERQPKHTLIAIHFCVRKVIEKDIPDNKDIGFLMGILTTIAEIHDKHNWDKDKLKDLDLDEKEVLACWHCVRICLDNKLIRNEEKKIFVTRAAFVLAKHLDEARKEFVRLDEEGKSKGLSLVSDS